MSEVAYETVNMGEEEKVADVVDETDVVDEVVDDDNELVTAEDLEATDDHPTIVSKWDDSNLIKNLQEQMDKLKGLHFKKAKYTDTILTMAMAEVLADLGWKSHQDFRNTVQNILQGPRNGPDRVPFSLKTRNKLTGRMDFWLVRTFVNVGYGQVYQDEEGNVIPKKDVLMSRQFSDFLRSYCRDQLKDEVQFWVFTGSFKGRQHLDLNKLVHADRQLLPDQNPNNLVMVQFKMKTPEQMIGVQSG